MLVSELIKRFIVKEQQDEVRIFVMRKGAMTHMWPLRRDNLVKVDDEVYIKVKQYSERKELP